MLLAALPLAEQALWATALYAGLRMGSRVRTLVVSAGAEQNFALDIAFKQTVTPTGDQPVYYSEFLFSECRGGGPPVPASP